MMAYRKIHKHKPKQKPRPTYKCDKCGFKGTTRECGWVFPFKGGTICLPCDMNDEKGN